MAGEGAGGSAGEWRAARQASMAFSTDTDEYPRMTRAVQALIAISVAIYFLQVAALGDRDVWHWLAFERGDLTHSVWTVVTYAFVHLGFWHLAFNMYNLWMFGPRVEHMWSPGRFVAFYLWCALGGVLGFLMFGGSGMLLGASAAVMGVMLAYAMHWPDEEFALFGVLPMKVKWLVAIMIVANLVQGVGSVAMAGIDGSGIAYTAHLGGLAFAWFYLRTPSAQSLDRLRQRISPVADIPDEPPRAVPRSAPRPRERTNERASASDEAVAKSTAVVGKRQAPPALPRAAADPRAEALNLVLDKISATGIQSLTSDERKLLDEMSRKLRGND
jgi:membrane associated rhomboid family serine protease